MPPAFPDRLALPSSDHVGGGVSGLRFSMLPFPRADGAALEIGPSQSNHSEFQGTLP